VIGTMGTVGDGDKFLSPCSSLLRRRRAWVQIAVATLSGNSLRQTVHTHCASVHQAAKLVAALLRATFTFLSGATTARIISWMMSVDDVRTPHMTA